MKRLVTLSPYHLVTLSTLALVLGLLIPTTFAQAPAVTTNGRAGNYCIECHVAGDTRLDRTFEWQGGISREQVSPCPTLKKLREQVYYTESLLGAMTNSGQGLRSQGISTAPMDKRVLARSETYGRLTQEQVTALTPVETELQSLRLQLNKSFSRMYSGWAAVNTRWAILAVAVVTVLLTGTAIWRLFKSPISNLQSPISSLKSLISKLNPLALVGGVVVFLLFALPVFSTAAPVSTAQTAEQASRQTALNEAALAAQAAETASARAWMLARIGASWAQVDQATGQAALAAGPSAALRASLEAFDEFQMNAPAYWGRVRRLEESAVTWTAGQADALDAADRIAIAASRAWALRAMAAEIAGAEIAAADRATAETLLARAQTLAEKNNHAYYRDVDLYGIAVEWSKLDTAKGLRVARSISDPRLQSAAFRDIGQANAHKSDQPVTVMFEQARQSARQAPPVDQAWALQELGALWCKFDPTTGAQVLNEAGGLAAQFKVPLERAFIQRNLAAAWASVDASRAAQIAVSIDATSPEAQASALLEARQFDQAVGQARRIDRAYRRDNALAAIAREWAAVAPDQALNVAPTIQDAYLRAGVQHAAALGLARSNPDQALQIAQNISVPFLQADALVKLGAFDQALACADQLQDTYPMKELAIAWAKVDLDRALQAVEKIQRDADRAEALREIAVIAAAKDKALAGALFDRARQTAQAMRRSGDPFASAEALRQLGVAWTAIDKAQAGQAFEAAFESARRVSVKY